MQLHRYRDVLTLLKQLARNPDVPSDGLRALIGGNLGEPYTHADLERTRELAEKFGWELSPDLEPDQASDDLTDVPRLQQEIRRLAGMLRLSRMRIKTLEHGNAMALEKSREKQAARTAQLQAAGVTSIDAAFALIAKAYAFLREGDLLEQFAEYDPKSED